MQNPNMKECPSENCNYMFEQENANQSYWFCPECQIEYCLNCGKLYHHEQTCEQAQEAYELHKEVK